VTVSTLCAQQFTDVRLINENEVPTEAFLYRETASVIKQAAKNVFTAYSVTSFFVGSREYFTFPGDSLGLVLLSGTYAKYWIEEMGEEKSVLYFTIFRNKTNQYAPVLKHTIVQNRIKGYLNAIESESLTIFSQMYLEDQYNKVLVLTEELQALYNELQKLESTSPNAMAELNQLRSTIRIKKANLDRETNVLNRLKETLEL
jgi:cell division protein FtsB